MRLIDADALKEKYSDYWDREIEHPKYQDTFGSIIDNEPTVEERPQGEWILCSERLPETDKKVLVNLHNTYGRDVILMASHIGYHERTSEDYGWQDFEGYTEYDEENDCFWIPECWCESNYVEDNANWIIDECEGIITHWMPLPEPCKIVF